jgi:hypothetical protein
MSVGCVYIVESQQPKRDHFLNKSSRADFTFASSASFFATYAPALGLK